MSVFDFTCGDIAIERITNKSYAVRYYNDRGEMAAERVLDLKALNRMSKMLRTYVRLEKKRGKGGGR